jgi:predicted hydrolase (HD superfamily)
MKTRAESVDLLEQYIENENLRHHSRMVAAAMEAYANKWDEQPDQIEAWWTAGLLHDLDWEKYPKEHPAKATSEILPQEGYSDTIIHAVEAHAPERTGREPKTLMERTLFACDELSGFMNAVSLVRPNGFADMKVKSVKKKLKDKSFSANVPREAIQKGAALINIDLNDHIAFLIEAFNSNYS